MADGKGVNLEITFSLKDMPAAAGLAIKSELYGELSFEELNRMMVEAGLHNALGEYSIVHSWRLF